MEEYTEMVNEFIGHSLRHDGLLLLILEVRRNTRW